MKPFIHAKNSVSKYGGSTSDYMDIHDFMDSSKSALPDHRHRAILHSAFGIYIIEKVFGAVRTNSEDKEYSVRDVAEDHVYEDLGFIPTMEQWFADMPIHDWMGGSERGKKPQDILFDGTKVKNPESVRISEEDMNKILDKIDQKPFNWPPIQPQPNPYIMPKWPETLPYDPNRVIVTD